MSDLASMVDGFNEGTMAELAELKKALDISGDNTAQVTGFDSLRVESLEATLKILTFRADNIRLWQAIPKEQAFSTVEEYNRLEEYGAFESGVFVNSGELPAEQDSVYSRQTQKVKYLGTTRVVNHPATLIRTVPSDLIAQETQNGALFLMGKLNQGLYFGDESVVPAEFNGLIQQIVSGSGHVIDLRGGVLTQDVLEDGAQLVNDNFGIANQMFGNPKIFSDFSKTFHALQRFQAPNVGSGVVGTPVTGFDSSVTGRINFNPDVFAARGKTPPAAAVGTGAPDAPTAVLLVRSAAETVTDGNVSQFAAADAGDYLYQVTAVNRFGESAPTALPGTAETLAVAESVRITITPAGGGTAATGYRIYRSDAGGTVLRATERVADSGMATTVPFDVNAELPGTFDSLLLDMSNQSLSFKQLSPMIRMALATIAPSLRWMQLVYGTPVVYQPKRNVVFKNIGLAS